MALSATIRTSSDVCSICLIVLAIIASSTGPLLSWRRWISSIMSSFTSSVYALSPDFLVMISHFSGVVTITWVSSIYCLVKWVSPVSSLTVIPYDSSLLWKLPTTSETRAFIGATYTILNDFKSTVLFERLRDSIHYKIVSIAMLVFPAPVGAHTNKLSGDLKAFSYNFD